VAAGTVAWSPRGPSPGTPWPVRDAWCCRTAMRTSLWAHGALSAGPRPGSSA